MAKPYIIDLFSGTGGFTLGAHLSGFRTGLAVEIEPNLRSSFGMNFPGTTVIGGDVSRLAAVPTIRGVGLHPDEIVGIIGGPPCQGFSDMGKRDPNDPRNGLIREFFRWVRGIRPQFFVMENVPGILTAPFDAILRSEVERTRGYQILGPIIVDAADYGAATKRKRVLVVGCRTGTMTRLTTQDLRDARTDPQDIRAAISDLPSPRTAARAEDGAHWACYRSEVAPSPYALRARAKAPPGLGSAEAQARLSMGQISGFQPTEHTTPVLNRWATLLPGEKDNVSKASRLRWDRPGPTLRAGTGPDRGSFQSVRPIHPQENRVITVREAARIQGFPDWFQFHPTIWHSFRMIGNSVSPYVSRTLLSLLFERLA